MLVLGVILIVIGGILVLISRRHGEPFLFWGGVIVFAGGVIFFLLAVLDVSGADTHAFIGGAVAMAIIPPHSHGPHDHEASIPVAASLPDRQPVLVAFAVAAVPIICAFALQVLDAAGALDSALWLRTLLTGLGGVTGALAAAWARSRVTPTAMPRLDDRTPLVPMIESERT